MSRCGIGTPASQSPSDIKFTLCWVGSELTCACGLGKVCVCTMCAWELTADLKGSATNDAGVSTEKGKDAGTAGDQGFHSNFMTGT